MRLARLTLVCLSGLLALGSAEEPGLEAMARLNRVFSPPADAGMINVRGCGAVGDGVSDDSEAFRKAIAESAKSGFFRPMVFVPRGTYLVTGTLSVGEGRFFSIVGEERERSIIRLKDASPGFQDAAKPAPVLEIGGGPNNNQAFGNYVHNLTISSGSGNPGACGLRFKASNYGATTELTIRSEDGAGVAGLLLDWADPGPEIHRNLHIIGFDHGIRSDHAMFGPVFENILLEGQRKAGLHNRNNCLWIRRLLSRNTVPALVNAAEGGKDKRPDASLILLDGSRLEGGDPGTSGLVLEAGMAYVRDLAVTGYGSAIRPAAGEPVIGPQVGLWTSHPNIAMPGATAAAPLRLPVREHPTPDYEPTGQWVNVRSFADEATPTMGWTGAIQRAIDSGAGTLYFPKGKYPVTQTIHLRGGLRRILGMCSIIDVDTDTLGDAPVFRFDGDQPQVVVEHLHTTISDRAKRNLGTTAWEHAAKGELVLAHALTHAYRSLPGSGPFFAMDTCSGAWRIGNPEQQVWLRSINIEGIAGGAPAQLNLEGGRTWILGFKTEGGHTCIDARGGALVELLGGFHYPAQGFGKQGQVPLYRLSDSRGAFTWSETAHGPKRGENRHFTQILQIRGEVQTALPLKALPKNLLEMKFGRVVNVPLAVVDP